MCKIGMNDAFFSNSFEPEVLKIFPDFDKNIFYSIYAAYVSVFPQYHGILKSY